MGNIGVRKSKGDGVLKNKVELSKPMSLSSKYQITVPEHVRNWLMLSAKDTVMFKTDGESVYFEKFVPMEESHLKLVTVARNTLKSGVPIYIHGGLCSGKTTLAKEIGSYEFEKVVYISPDINNNNKKANALFLEALNTFTSRGQLLILDEYMYLGKDSNIKVDRTFMEQFKGSLIVITQIEEYLPSFDINEHLYSIKVNDLRGCTDHEMKQFTRVISEDNISGTKMIATKVTVDSTSTPDALTIIGALWFIEEKLKENGSAEFFFQAQQLRLLSLIESQIYRITLIEEIPHIIDLYLKDEPELEQYTISIKLLLDSYLLKM